MRQHWALPAVAPDPHAACRVFSAMKNVLLLSLLVILSGAAPAHDVHVTTTRMAVSPRSAFVRIRMFHDDLQEALRKHAAAPALQLAAGQRTDSIFMDYLHAHFQLVANGTPLRATLVASGEEDGMRPELDIWWVDIAFVAPADMRQMTIRNDMMFELFRDQNHVIRVQLPGGREKSLFLVNGDSDYTLRW